MDYISFIWNQIHNILWQSTDPKSISIIYMHLIKISLKRLLIHNNNYKNEFNNLQ
jgi:hypothetical protein